MNGAWEGGGFEGSGPPNPSSLPGPNPLSQSTRTCVSDIAGANQSRLVKPAWTFIRAGEKCSLASRRLQLAKTPLWGAEHPIKFVRRERVCDQCVCCVCGVLICINIKLENYLTFKNH